jgi:hypothetical protein
VIAHQVWVGGRVAHRRQVTTAQAIPVTVRCASCAKFESLSWWQLAQHGRVALHLLAGGMRVAVHARHVLLAVLADLPGQPVA